MAIFIKNNHYRLIERIKLLSKHIKTILHLRKDCLAIRREGARSRDNTSFNNMLDFEVFSK